MSTLFPPATISENAVRMKCGKCENDISPTKRRATCAKCNVEFHLNKACAGIQPESWRTKSEQGRLNWSCRVCRNLEDGTNSSHHSRESSVDSSKTELSNPCKKRKQLEEETMMNSGANFDRSLIASIIKDAVTQASASFSEVLDDKLDAHLHTITQEQENMKKEIGIVKEETSYLRWKLEDHDQYSRRNNVVVSGVPHIKGEKPLETVKRIAGAFKYDLQVSAIDDCHRLPIRNKNTEYAEPGPQDFIIRFVSRIIKRDFLIHCKKNRIDGSAFGSPASNKVYVNEHLTRRTKSILMEAKKLLRNRGYRVETRNCIVFIKKDGWMNGKAIHDMDQLRVYLEQNGEEENNETEGSGRKNSSTQG